MAEMGLSRALGSPNGAMRAPQLYVWKLHSEVTSWLVAEGRHTRQIHGVQQVFTPDLQKRRGWNGITISRDTIHIPGIELGFKRPVLFERHAVGGEYGAGWKKVGKGRLLTTFFPENMDEAKPTIVDGRELKDNRSVCVVYDNPLDNVEDLAHVFFQRCLEAEVVPYVVTKKTVFKWQEGFWQIMRDVFDSEYKAAFLSAGLLDKTGGELQHLISDAATMQIIRWTDGGFGMACHNYDGDMLTDEVAQVHRSPGFITSNLIGKREDGALIKEFEVARIGGEIKLFPPPTYHGELDKWDDWSWQLKRYVGLYKPLAKMLMDEIEANAQKVVTDGLCEAYDVQQTSSQNNQLSLFSKLLAYMLAQITDGAARAIVRNEDTENGFEIWRRLFNQFSLPTRAHATNLLNEIIAFRLRTDHLESDLNDFIILKTRHEKTTGTPLDNDLLITVIMQKTTGPLQQHLKLNVRNITTFTEALEIVHSYIKSRHLVVPSRNDGPVDMDIGALKGRKGYGKEKGKGKGGMYKGKGKGFKGKGMFKGKGKGKSKGFKGKKGKGMKGKGQGCFICGGPNHWSKDALKVKEECQL
eukprot:s4651_g5.t1